MLISSASAAAHFSTAMCSVSQRTQWKPTGARQFSQGHTAIIQYSLSHNVCNFRFLQDSIDGRGHMDSAKGLLLCLRLYVRYDPSQYLLFNRNQSHIFVLKYLESKSLSWHCLGRLMQVKIKPAGSQWVSGEIPGKHESASVVSYNSLTFPEN